MRILSAAVLAALFTAGTLTAYAQTTAPATTKVKCRNLAEADCKAPDCTWTPPADPSQKGKCSRTKKTQ